MFSGIIEATGRIETIRPQDGVRRVRIAPTGAAFSVSAGESVSVSGACLTAVRASGEAFEADVGPETAARTTLGAADEGRLVNLERALPAQGRLSGHLVLGHVDCVGRVTKVEGDGAIRRLGVAVPGEFRRFLADQGSVAVDGVSLTVAKVTEEGFEAMLVPYTLEATTLSAISTGEHVNIECDVLARYVERQLAFLRPAEGRG